MALNTLGSVGSVTATAAATQAADSSLTKLGADYRSFLQLLTAQITNQDPLKPIDSTTFVTQLAQLSQVEQAVSQNANLEAIANQMSGLGAMAGLALIGREVMAPSSQVTLDANGAGMGYRLGAEANSVTLSIRDESGTIRRVLKELPTSADTLHSVQWDGLDLTGAPMPDGVYSITIEALDADGGVIDATPYAEVAVRRMTFEGGVATLELGNGENVAAGLIEAIG